MHHRAILSVVTTVLTLSATTLAERTTRFLGTPVREPMRVELADLRGRPLVGDVIGFADAGFVLDPPQGQPMDVQWRRLEPEDVFDLHVKLLGADPSRARDWLGVGSRLMARDTDEGDDYAERAMRAAVKLDATLRDKVIEAVTNHRRRRAAEKRAAKQAAADPSPRTDDADRPDPPQTRPQLSPHAPRRPYWPAAYEPRWDIGIEPWELARDLRGRSGFGYYRSADPLAYLGGRRLDRDSDDYRGKALREFEGWSRDDWTISSQTMRIFHLYHNYRHYPKRAKPGMIIGGMLQAEFKDLYRVWTSALERGVCVALQEAPDLAVELAEARLRICPASELDDAYEQLAFAYMRNDQQAQLERLLAQGLDFRAPWTCSTELGGPGYVAALEQAPYYAEPTDPAALESLEVLLNHGRLAILKHDEPAVRRWLDRLRDLAARRGMDDEQWDGVWELQLLLRRSRASVRASLTGKQADASMADVEAVLDRLRSRESLVSEYLARAAGRPPRSLDDRLGHLSNEQVLDLARRRKAVFGEGSDLAADPLLYLLEQRRWQGEGARGNLIMWLGFHIQRSYGKARALPVYVLAQRAAMLGDWDAEQFPGEHYVAMECGLWVQRCFEDRPDLPRHVPWTPMLNLVRLSQKLANDPETEAMAPNSWSHRYLVNESVRLLHTAFNRIDSMEEELWRVIRTSDNESERYQTRYQLGRHYKRQGMDEMVIKAYSGAARGEDGPDAAVHAVWMIWELSRDRGNDREIFDRAQAFAAEAVQRLKDHPNREFVQRLIQMAGRTDPPDWQ